jgi:hypothetical protein
VGVEVARRSMRSGSARFSRSSASFLAPSCSGAAPVSVLVSRRSGNAVFRGVGIELIRLANDDDTPAPNGSPIANARPPAASVSDGGADHSAVETLDRASAHADAVGGSG